MAEEFETILFNEGNEKILLKEGNEEIKSFMKYAEE